MKSAAVGFFFVCLTVFMSAVLTDSDGSTADPQTHFLFHKIPMAVDFTINVALVGFNGEGNLGYKIDADKTKLNFSSLLQTSLPIHTPSLVSEGRELAVQFNLHYNVYHATEEATTQLERIIAGSIQGDVASGSSKPPGGLFRVHINKLEPLFDTIARYPDMTNQRYAGYTVFLLNPSMEKIKEMAGVRRSAVMQYAYETGVGKSSVASPARNFQKESTVTQSWVTQGRAVAVDITAGPVYFGPSDVGLGAISKDTFPKLDVYARRVPLQEGVSYTISDFVEIKARLASLVISAVRYVFIPDIQFAPVDVDKVLVPIVVFRNHVEWDPLQPGHKLSIDVAAIEREVSKIALPNQHVTVLADMHGMHEHKHVSVAVSKATKTNSVHEMSQVGYYEVKESPYLDGRALIQELKDSRDILASGYIGKDEHIKGAFLSDKTPSVKGSSGTRGIGQGLAGTTVASEEFEHKGTSILPVYVFSLAGVPRNLLVDRESLVRTSREAVVVLQTNTTEVVIPYFSQSLPLRLHPRSVTADIVAGIATALGGLAPPYARLSPLLRRQKESMGTTNTNRGTRRAGGTATVAADVAEAVEEEYTWAHGEHPFGPFAGAREGESRVPEVFHDLVRRNHVLARLDAAIGAVNRAIEKVQAFAKMYVFETFGDVDEALLVDTGTLLDEMLQYYAQSGGDQAASSLGQRTVDHLYTELKKLEKQYMWIGSLIKDYKLEEAYLASASITTTSKAFEQYVEAQLALAEQEFTCCFLKHDVAPQSASRFFVWLLVFLGVGLASFGVVMAATSPSTRLWNLLGLQGKRQHGNKRHPSRRYTAAGRRALAVNKDQ